MIYLDHAATSFPKPNSVRDAVAHWYAEVGVSADRGDGPATREAAATTARARQRTAQLCGVQSERIAFCSGATEGLNLALRALLPNGARVLTTPFEHSSVARPLHALQRERDLHLLHAGERDGQPDDDGLAAALVEGHPDLLVFTHASNVTGAAFDAVRLCRLAREHGVRTLLDACQTAGVLPIDVGADVVVASAHKSLLGPPGLGFVAARPELDLAPQKQGGTGSSTALAHHPEQWPQAFEAGTPNTPAIFALDSALGELEDDPAPARRARSLQALDRLADGLLALPDVTLFRATREPRVAVLSCRHARFDPLELAALLAAAGVQTRAGFHCAPWVHERLGTDDAGTLRLSPGPDTEDADVDYVLELLRGL